MEEKLFTGTISFVHHQKHYATIDYMEGTKKKTINFQTGLKNPALSGVSEKDKNHYFRTGDTVNFQQKLTPRGDRLNAYDVKFLYNNDLDKLIQKASIDNQFKGFLKMVDDTYFVKETGSYIFFPLLFSPWEKKPSDDALNDPIFFSLNNTANPARITASLYRNNYIPEYLTAMKYFKNKSLIDATVYKITPHGIFVNVVGDKIQAKIPVEKSGGSQQIDSLKVGDIIKVIITYLGHSKIIVERKS